MIKDKRIHINYVELDILCDGLFILSCLGELDVHRKVRFLIIINNYSLLFIGNFW